MCLTVYIGSSLPITLQTSVATGSLALEPAKWTPPPLRRLSHVYYAGQKGADGGLECSCFLSELIRWDRNPPEIELADVYPDEGPCPFDTLRGYCEQVLAQGGSVVLASDDSGGIELDANEGDYHWGCVLTDQIQRGRLVFSDADGGFPWRALAVLPAGIAVQRARGD